MTPFNIGDRVRADHRGTDYHGKAGVVVELWNLELPQINRTVAMATVKFTDYSVGVGLDELSPA